MAIRKNMKLSLVKYHGPFKVTEKVGKVAYKLQLPSDSRIHPFFHVSLFKKKISQKKVHIQNLPYADQSERLKVEPKAILDRRMIK